MSSVVWVRDTHSPVRAPEFFLPFGLSNEPRDNKTDLKNSTEGFTATGPTWIWKSYQRELGQQDQKEAMFSLNPPELPSTTPHLQNQALAGIHCQNIRVSPPQPHRGTDPSVRG
ncbi:hypothetical protein CRENBAI_012924 [Crenichthys baileyi]|uniref:Uncharacterized protein n=1 Tax=Crenichthys baileyi TaxID=28760 RepID=A0AAV9RFF0_9TELE